MNRDYAACRSLQLAGCLNPVTFNPVQDVLSRYFAGATWHANLHKEGNRWLPSRGGARKLSSKSKRKISQLKSDLRFDRNHFVIP